MATGCTRGSLGQLFREISSLKRWLGIQQTAQDSGGVIPGSVQETWKWHFETQFSSEHGGAVLTVGLYDPGGIFQPKWFCDSLPCSFTLKAAPMVFMQVCPDSPPAPPSLDPGTPHPSHQLHQEDKTMALSIT